MNSYLPQSLVTDHIRESRQQAAEARTATAMRRARRAGHRLVRGA